MAIIKITKKRPNVTDNLIKVTKGRISFLTNFVKAAELKKYPYVRVYVDSVNERMGFKFSRTEEDGAYKISGFSNSSCQISSVQLLKIDWVLNVDNSDSNQFLATKENNYWVIALNEKNNIDFDKIDWKLVPSLNKKTDKHILTVRNEGRLNFSQAFVNVALIEEMKSVDVEINTEIRSITFEFNKDESGALKILGNREQGYHIQNSQISNLPWIENIQRTNENKFLIEKASSKWVVNFAPTFESKVSRKDFSTIPSSASGIYRYISKGEIIYIGKGNIRKRYSVKSRIHWEFDTIEYSEVQKEKQHYWENFWINSFKNSYGKLPRENKIHGFDK
jgi:hypothetical protein